MRVINQFAVSLCLLAIGSKAAWAGGTSVVAKVSLFPAGSFETKSSSLEGKFTKEGDAFTAKEIKVPVSTLETGITLRDDHMRKRLNETQYPFVLVEDVTANKESGSASIAIAGVKKPVAFKLTDLGSGLAQITFSVALPDFKIAGINYMGVGVEDQIDVAATIPYDQR